MINSHSDRPDYDVTARRGGVVALVVYLVAVALAMWLVQCNASDDIELEELEQGSILISFGNSDEGSGELRSEDTTQQVESIPTPEPEPIPDPLPTDENSEIEQPQPEEEVPQEEVVAPREVNQRALFPGTTKTQESPSEGQQSEKSGVVGSDRGTSEASSELGSGLSGDFNLSGRSLVGRLPVPRYDEQQEGRVVITIYVDMTGKVISAHPSPTGSTTNSQLLIEAARKAALEARFTTSDTFEQSGTITYIFKLN
ncbi:MAG: energy transducer TonB [Rikenellaceae bacterium]